MIVLLFATVCFAHAFPSTNFFQKKGDWYDDWDIDRNYYGGPQGYLPNLASETIGANKEGAYSIGESLRSIHTDKVETAKAILEYVQTWTTYGYDSENVFREGVAQDEWAWNADEMAYAFNETTGIQATGDCEDLAFLCATIYTGAGIDAAVVDATEHVACLIWLPEYENANQYWDIPDDNRSSGWIWVEATGASNPLGWTPPDFADGDWNAYPIGAVEKVPEQPAPLSITVNSDLILGIAVIAAVLIIVSLIFRSKKSSGNR
jgi:hypothetical protein